MSYRVCLPTAGTGSRLGELTRFLNKSLVGIANRPILSHLIEQFSEDAEFVIALGHKGHLVREFLALAYPAKRFLFAEVSPFEGPSSGLGLSLLACQQYLQQPFVFISCDTLVRGAPIPPPETNWMACAEVGDLAPYRTLALRGGNVEAICEKGEGRLGSHQAYIGLAGIHDHQAFWTAMQSGGAQAIHTGEAYGLRALLPQGIAAHTLPWYDTGNPPALTRAREAYQEPDAPNILEKATESIWFVDSQVIKFSDDEKFIANRVRRVEQLVGYVPIVTGTQPHMYRYGKVAGQVMSEVVTLPLFDRLLTHSEGFWTRQSLGEASSQAFRQTCMAFYREKTHERVALFYRNFGRQDGTEAINGRALPTLASLLAKVDWNWLADGLPGRFHGDFHFENILWNSDAQQFCFLDWRQDFGGNLATGDINYDLAKLLHGLIISHELIARDLYGVDWQADAIRYDFHRKQVLVACERHFAHWLRQAGYDVAKVWTLTALIYLNIAALHHAPYSLLLYALGKDMLAITLEDYDAN
ncbi:MAG: phosphotransferase [Burkholderiales bacterium]|nr:phosphotransferase [Burkholderiales bacterium]